MMRLEVDALRSLCLTVGVMCVSGLLTACSSGGSSPASSSSARVSSPASSPATSSTATSSSATPAPSNIASAVTVAMQRWARADTPAEACAAVSDGFATFLGDGSAAQCVAHVTTKVGPLKRGTARVTKVTLDGSQAVVTATISGSRPTPTDYYFVETAGVWKLNSIGERH